MLPEPSALTLLAQAAARMDEALRKVWEGRDQDLPLSTPGELLTLASLIEKETGFASDRPRVSRVFHNRLREGMRLQTDVSVIYGLGPAFDGDLTRADLRRDTPYNSYRRAGLPPTPIAFPGAAALSAAAHPEPGAWRYFVARGDGTSVFSVTLADHERAVDRYQRQAAARGERHETGTLYYPRRWEGAGKSTQLQTVARHLTAAGIPFLTTREPGGTSRAEAIRGCS